MKKIITKNGRQGDIAFRKISELPQNLTSLDFDEARGGYTLALGEHSEKILLCECHKVDTAGNLFSCLKQSAKKGIQGIQTDVTDIWKKMNGVKTNKGYIQIALHGKNIRLNRLIAENFIPNPQKYPEAHHLDGNPLNNKIENLEWGDALSNAQDRERHGRTYNGTQHWSAKINEFIAMEIFRCKDSLMNIAKKYSVSKKLVLLIKQKKIWKKIHTFNENAPGWDASVGGFVLARGEHSNHKHVAIPLEGAEVKAFTDGKYNYLSISGGNVAIKHGTFVAPTKVNEEELDKHLEEILYPGLYRQNVKIEYDPFLKQLRAVTD